MNVSRTMSESALRETRGVHERPTESQVHDAVRTERATVRLLLRRTRRGLICRA